VGKCRHITMLYGKDAFRVLVQVAEEDFLVAEGEFLFFSSVFA